MKHRIRDLIKEANLTPKRIIIYSVVLMCLFFLDFLGFFEFANNYFYDLFFRIRGQTEHRKEILLVNIDDKTLEHLGRWPIKRSSYAHLIDRAHNARVILFDIIMAEPTNDDHLMEKAIKSHRCVLLPVIVEENKRVIYPSVSLPHEQTGHIHIEQDVDGVVRSVYHTITVFDKTIPSISSVAYEYITGKKFKRDKVKKEGHNREGSRILQSDRMRINYTGGYGTYESVSFIDVVEGMYPTSFFRDKILIVGLTATGTFDIIITPFLKERRGMTGIELQANILNTLLVDNAIEDIDIWLIRAIAFILLITLFIFFMKTTEKKAAFTGLALIAFVFVITYVLHAKFNIWLPPIKICIGVFFNFILSYILKFDDATKMLMDAYTTLESRLRWVKDEEKGTQIKKGISNLLTKKGIYNQAKILSDVGIQLNFEKELLDRALMSDIQGVLLFNNNGKNILTNGFAYNIIKESKIEAGSLKEFLETVQPYLLEKTDPGIIIENLYNENKHLTYTLSFTEKEKRFYKMDFSFFGVDGMRYLLVLLTDITKVKELELLKTHIISVVSHELKGPMTSIHGFSEILSEKLTGKMQSFAEIIHRESERLVRFLNTFLDITRIEEGRQPLKITPVNLIEVIEEVARALKPIGDANRIEIFKDLPEKVENIMLDRDLTKQCIFNLVENAIKYSPQERDVLISLKDEGNTMRVDIIDHGYGIKEEDLGRVFDKFFRSGSEKTKNIKGSGLGLTFVKEAVELQGGTLSVKSKYNEGSTFSIHFPKTSG